jgi:3-dehydroquinate dehydratase-2
LPELNGHFCKRPSQTSSNFAELDTIVQFDKTTALFEPRPSTPREFVLAKILVLHGPNLNLLGTREPDIYGRETLAEINAGLASIAESAGHSLTDFQSNAEHGLIDCIHAARSEGVSWIIINPGAFTHTSIALRDALAAVAIPFIETHLSNVHAREAFRQHSYLSDLAHGVVTGFGADSYRMALEFVVRRLATT